MRARRAFIPLSILLLLAGLGLLTVHECAHGGGMGAAYSDCDCLGWEWEWYDRTAADGQRKTLCIGIVQARACYAYIGGPAVPCEPEAQVTVRTDRRAYAIGDDITVTVENPLTSPIGYDDFCSLHLCRYLEWDWRCETKECHGPTVVVEPGSSVAVPTQERYAAGARMRYRLDYQIASDGMPHTAYSNEFTVEPGSMVDAGHSVYVRQIIPGEAWLEDGTSLTFESPTAPKRVQLDRDATRLEVGVGHKGARAITRNIRFTVALLGEDIAQVDCPEGTIRVETGDHIEQAVNEAIRAYEPVTVPKHRWVEILTYDAHNAPKWQLWWGGRPPSELERE